MPPTRTLVVIGCVALLGGASTVQAALWWSATGSVAISARPAPVVFEWGANANNSRHVTGLALSPQRTSFSAGFTGRAGAEAVVTDVLRLQNLDDAPRSVTLSGDAMPNPRVIAFEWRVKDGGAEVGRLDHKTSTPTLSFTLPQGASYRLDLRNAFAAGAGSGDASSFTVQVKVE